MITLDTLLQKSDDRVGNDGRGRGASISPTANGTVGGVGGGGGGGGATSVTHKFTILNDDADTCLKKPKTCKQKCLLLSSVGGIFSILSAVIWCDDHNYPLPYHQSLFQQDIHSNFSVHLL